MRAILAAIDFSRVTDLIVMEAARLARALQGKVVLVTVLVEPVYAKVYARTEKAISRITVSHERAVRKCLAAIQQQLQSEFVPAETVVRRGNPAQHLLEESEEHDAAFIVIGSHGHTAFFELLLGSTTQAVLKRSRRPVVVIPSRMRKPKRSRRRPVAAAAAD
jgi:nucleotide-binding universal stress UspA family protein